MHKKEYLDEKNVVLKKFVKLCFNSSKLIDHCCMYQLTT